MLFVLIHSETDRFCCMLECIASRAVESSCEAYSVEFYLFNLHDLLRVDGVEDDEVPPGAGVPMSNL